MGPELVAADLCAQWDLCLRAPPAFVYGLGIGVGLTMAALVLSYAAALLKRLREWRASRIARKSGGRADPTDQRVETAARAVQAMLVHEALRAEASGPRVHSSANDLYEAEWIAVLEAGSASARVRAVKASPRQPPEDVMAAYEASEAAFAARQGVEAAAASAIVLSHLSRSGHAFATLIYASRTIMRLRLCGRGELTDPYVALIQRAARQAEFKPATALTALLTAQRAIEKNHAECVRETLGEPAVSDEGALPALEIAAIDLSVRFAEVRGNFPRVRSELQRRLRAEERHAPNARTLRIARGHYLSDLGRVELLETRYIQGRRVRQSGRRAERLLRQSARAMLACRDGTGLALVYTRLAMAAVAQHHLRTATAWAQKGRALAQAARAFDLVSAADDLIGRIEIERQARREWLPLARS